MLLDKQFQSQVPLTHFSGTEQKRQIFDWSCKFREKSAILQI